MAWSTPIIDRTQADVLYAIANQNLVTDLKGALNVSDVNRMIDNIKYLDTLLDPYGYPQTVLPQSNVTESDLPYVNSVIDTIRKNINTIVNSFYKRGNPSIRFGDILDYNDVNTLEINIKITNDLIVSLIKLLKYSGTFYSGDTIIL